MNFLGIDGYERLATQTMETAQNIRQGVEELGLKIIGEPVDGSGLRIIVGRARHHGGRKLGGRPRPGLDRQHGPDALHMMMSPAHHRIVDELLGDLRHAVWNAGDNDKAAKIVQNIRDDLDRYLRRIGRTPEEAK